MTFLTALKSRIRAVAAYVGDTSRRRALATFVAIVLAKSFGRDFDIDSTETIVTLAIGVGAAMWTHKTVPA